MQNNLPAYLVRSTADIYTALSLQVLSEEGEIVDLQTPVQLEQNRKEEELCIICMEEYAVGQINFDSGLLWFSSIGHSSLALWPCTSAIFDLF